MAEHECVLVAVEHARVSHTKVQNLGGVINHNSQILREGMTCCAPHRIRQHALCFAHIDADYAIDHTIYAANANTTSAMAAGCPPRIAGREGPIQCTLVGSTNGEHDADHGENSKSAIRRIDQMAFHHESSH